MHVTRLRTTAASCALAASVLTALTGASSTSASAEVLMCDGHEATIVHDGGVGALIRGTDGDDVIVGTEDRDVIRAGAGNDIVCGRAGADELYGEAGDDRVFGDEDHITVDGRQDGDALSNGPGSDYFDAGFQPLDGNIEGSPNVLLQQSDAGGPLTIFVDHTATHGIIHGPDGAEDLFVRHPRLVVRGGRFHDTLHGSPGPDRLQAAGQGDAVYGYGGDDELTNYSARPSQLYGGDGDDRITSTSFYASTVLGGNGDDVVTQTVARIRPIVTRGKAGFDVLRIRISYNAFRKHLVTRVNRRENTVQVGTSQVGRISSYERIWFDTNRRVVFRGSGGDDWVRMISGGPLKAWTYRGDDYVVGSEKDDYIRAGRGRDFVSGGTGHDVCRNAELGAC